MTELAKIWHFIITGRGCIIDLVLLVLTIFSRSYADSFLN